MWKLLVKEQMQACWIRAFVVSCWSTVSARGWSAWGYHLWRVNSSNRYWERNMIFPIRTMGKLKINQPVVWCSCTCQIRYSHSNKNSTPCGQTAGGNRAPRSGAWWVRSTHVWASERGAVSVDCGPWLGRSPQGERGPIILLLRLPAHWMGR